MIEHMRRIQDRGAQERLIKILTGIAVILGITLFGLTVYILHHFITKFW